jgi:hypothetical protein
MARDTAIMHIAKPMMKGNKRLRDALALYSGGDEEGALRQLAPNRRYPELDSFAEIPSEELMLVAVALLAKKGAAP